MAVQFRCLNLGHCAYDKAYTIQMRLHKERCSGKIPDTLLLLTHPPVYTIGRAGSRKHILVPDEVLEREGIEVFEIDRGGDITYHGPGQLVGYPILDLRQHGKDLHKLHFQYEEVLIRVLKENGVEADRDPKYPGVWIGREKIAALGIGVSNWVSYHGWSLNIAPDLAHFSFITPCGIPNKGITSLQKILDKDISEEKVMKQIVKHFNEVFNFEMINPEIISELDLLSEEEELGYSEK